MKYVFVLLILLSVKLAKGQTLQCPQGPIDTIQAYSDTSYFVGNERHGNPRVYCWVIVAENPCNRSIDPGMSGYLKDMGYNIYGAFIDRKCTKQIWPFFIYRENFPVY